MTDLKKEQDAYKYAAEKPQIINAEQKLRIGIIGTGWIAESYILRLKQMPDAQIAAVSDLIPGKAEKFLEQFGVKNVPCYLSHRDMLKQENLDAVCVCTPNMAHAECAIDALNAGVNVILEKPMCVTLDEGIEIMRAEKKSGKLLSVGFQPRYNPNMKKIKEIVQSGILGKIYYIQTGGGRRKGIPTPFGTSFIEKELGGIGAVGDIGCYSLDMVLNAIGYPKPLTVSGYTSDFFGKNPEYYAKINHPEYAEKFGVDDFSAAFIRLEGGIILDFRIAWAMHLDTPGDTIIMGTKGSLRIPSTECWNGSIGGDLKLYRDELGEPVITTIPAVPDSACPDVFELKIRSFFDAIKTGGSAPVPTSEIIINQAIIDGIIKSAELGREIEIEIPEV